MRALSANEETSGLHPEEVGLIPTGSTQWGKPLYPGLTSRRDDYASLAQR